MSVESRLADVEESLRLLRNADRLQGRRFSAAAPSPGAVPSWNTNTKVWEPSSGLLDRDLDQVDVENTTDASSLYSHSIPGNTLGATGGARLLLSGDMLVAVTGTYTIAVKFGTTTIFTSSTQDMADSANRRNWGMVIEFMNSATNAQKWIALMHTMNATADTFPIGGADIRQGIGLGSSSEDTTSARTLDVIVTWSTASASLSMRKEMAIMELLAAT
ncbi:hypothetical protein LCGC14_0981720 [marine sediment metagenome]|uniref:Uncharacterized protein n=1 Tax=marine sediment metagenome TaxID=412755 RepID=A0A0F9ND13_9ZZZZ